MRPVLTWLLYSPNRIPLLAKIPYCAGSCVAMLESNVLRAGRTRYRRNCPVCLLIWVVEACGMRVTHPTCFECHSITVRRHTLQWIDAGGAVHVQTVSCGTDHRFWSRDFAAVLAARRRTLAEHFRNCMLATPWSCWLCYIPKAPRPLRCPRPCPATRRVRPNTQNACSSRIERTDCP